MIFVRPSRSATVRTRLDAGAIQERLTSLVDDPGPQGFARWRAHGFFVGGSVGADEFTIDYKFNNFKNPQTYAIHGRLEDTKEWRVLRLRLTSHSPWISWVEVTVLAALTVLFMSAGDMPPAPAIGFFLFLVGIPAFANLLWIPSVANKKVAARVAMQVDGSVVSGDEWAAR